MSSRPTALAQGNQFRDHVKRLIELTPGCSNVQSECLIGTQPVDIYYEERVSFRVLRVVCECKDHGRPLTKDFISHHIYPRYYPLLQNRVVDAVRLIAPLELGSVASAYVRECGFSFQTLDQVESQVVDFREYMRSLKVVFAQDGLERYYIDPTLADGGSLESAILGWIEGSSSQPVAILAGYGMGKTSFARRLAHGLAERALKDPRNRIPILIPLSEISSEQTLEGLLGKLLAAQNRVPGYHFSVFSELNRRGRFVTILDGFDEMKHMMSWTQFTHNFSEINRLNGPNARVLLLGRPSALLSDAEEQFVLRGRRRVGAQTYTVPGAPTYLQYGLREFTSSQAIEFIRRYALFRSQADSATRGLEYGSVDIEARVRSIQTDAEMMSLIGRPVQARMMADLAMDPEVAWRSFSRYDLYREFIDRITEREARKPARAIFSQDVRRSFIRKVAWWLWGEATSSGFNITELPDLIILPLLGDADASLDGARRDLVAGSILERKSGETYYFPHRSFLEFLVAEYVCLEDLSPFELSDLAYSLTVEVGDFIRESGHASRVAQWEQGIDNVPDSITKGLLTLIAWASNRIGAPHNEQADADITPRALLVDYFRLLERGVPMTKAVDYLMRAFQIVANPHSRLACIVGLMLAEVEADPQLKRTLRMKIAVAVLRGCFNPLPRLGDSNREIRRQSDMSGPLVSMLLGGFTLRKPAPETTIAVDFGLLYREVSDAQSVRVKVGDLNDFRDIPTGDDVEEIPLTELAQIDGGVVLSASGAELVHFLTRFPDQTGLLPSNPK